MAEDGVAREPGETPIVACKRGKRERNETSEKIATGWKGAGREGGNYGFRAKLGEMTAAAMTEGRTWGRTGGAKVEGET